MVTVGLVYCREVAGLDDSLSSCLRQVEVQVQGGAAKKVEGAEHSLWAMEDLGGNV